MFDAPDRYISRKGECVIDKKLFEELYRQYYKPLFLYAFSLTHVEADAEDITANAFVKALTTFQSGNIRAWLYTVLHNEFLDIKRRQRRETNLDDDMIQTAAAEDDVWQDYLENEKRHWLYKQISNLPGLEREVMLLTIQTDYNDNEISEILGVTVANVRVLRHRAKKRLIATVCEEEKL